MCVWVSVALCKHKCLYVCKAARGPTRGSLQGALVYLAWRCSIRLTANMPGGGVWCCETDPLWKLGSAAFELLWLVKDRHWWVLINYVWETWRQVIRCGHFSWQCINQQHGHPFYSLHVVLAIIWHIHKKNGRMLYMLSQALWFNYSGSELRSLPLGMLLACFLAFS